MDAYAGITENVHFPDKDKVCRRRHEHPDDRDAMGGYHIQLYNGDWMYVNSKGDQTITRADGSSSIFKSAGGVFDIQNVPVDKRTYVKVDPLGGKTCVLTNMKSVYINPQGVMLYCEDSGHTTRVQPENIRQWLKDRNLCFMGDEYLFGMNDKEEVSIVNPAPSWKDKHDSNMG